MWLDALALGIFAVFALIGALRGAFATFMGIAALVAGYGAAIALAPVIGPPIASELDVSELIAVPLSGTALFIAAYAAVGAIGKLARRMTRRNDGVRSARDRFLGGVFGAARGALVVLLVSWLALWMDALRATGTAPSIPEIGSSHAASVTGDLVESGLEAALADAGAGGRVVARMAARPGVAIVEFQNVLEDPEVMRLRSDPMFWTYVEHDNVEGALNRLAFQRMLQDAELRQRLADLGLVSEDAAADPRAFRREMGSVLEEVGPRIRGLKDDPAMQDLVEDPQVIAMVQSGDSLGLLTHPGVRRLVDKVADKPASSGD
jgi:uncharacterized membrane protein required for colicin V production